MITPSPLSYTHDVSTSTQRFSMVVGKDGRMAGSVPAYQRFGDFLEKNADTNSQNNKSLGFTDIIDILNPLHHIPVVSHFYQQMTGDSIGSMATIIGGGLFGGPLGLVAGMGMVAYESSKQQKSSVSPENVTFAPLNSNNRYNT